MMRTANRIVAIVLVAWLGNISLGQDAAPKPDKEQVGSSKNSNNPEKKSVDSVLPEVQVAKDKYDKATAAAAEIYIGKQIVAKKAYVTSMEQALKGALRSKKIAEANLINEAKDKAKQEISEIFKQASVKGKGVVLEFEAGVKANATHPTARLALKRHDFFIASARKVYAQALKTASRQQLRELDAALSKAASAGDLKKANTITAAIKEAKIPSKTAAAATAKKALPSKKNRAKLLSRDIGDTRSTGSTTASGSIYTVKGSGNDVWGSADSFHFASTKASGDVEIIARVISFDPVNKWTKVGVMIRGSLDKGAAHAFMLVSPQGTWLNARTESGGGSWKKGGNSDTAPVYLKLTRKGDLLTGYSSVDGKKWKSIGSNKVALEKGVYVGLAVCSRANGKLAMAKFDTILIRANAK